MNTRILLSAAFGAAFAALPAVALADLNVTANGFHRVVAEAANGDSCEVYRNGPNVVVRCPDGSKGTLTMYRHTSEGAACELDFWAQGNGKWRAQLSHVNTANGTCTVKWDNGTTVEINTSP